MSQLTALSGSHRITSPPAAELPFMFEEDKPLYFTAHKLQQVVTCLQVDQDADAHNLFGTIPVHLQKAIFIQLARLAERPRIDVLSGQFIFHLPKERGDYKKQKIAAIQAIFPTLLSYHGRVKAIATLFEQGQEERATAALQRLPQAFQERVSSRLQSGATDHKAAPTPSTHSAAQKAIALRASLSWLNNDHVPNQVYEGLIRFTGKGSLRALGLTCTRFYGSTLFALNIRRLGDVTYHSMQTAPIALIPSLISGLTYHQLSDPREYLVANREFCFGLHNWKTSGSRTSLVQGYMRHLLLPMLRSSPVNEVAYLETMLAPYLMTEIAVWEKECHTFFCEPYAPNPRILLFAALKHHSALLQHLKEFENQKTLDYATLFGSFAEEGESRLQSIQANTDFLYQNKHISSDFAFALIRFQNKTSQIYDRLVLNFQEMDAGIFQDGLKQSYTLHLSAYKIDALDDDHQDTSFITKKYVENVARFSDRMQSYHSWLDKQCLAIQRILRQLKNFDAFIRMENLATLEKDAAQRHSAALEDFLRDKLAHFSARLERERGQQLQSLVFLKDSKLKPAYQRYTALMQALKNLQILAHHHFFHPIRNCQKYRHNLFHGLDLQLQAPQHKSSATTTVALAAKPKAAPLAPSQTEPVPKRTQPTLVKTPDSAPIFTLTQATKSTATGEPAFKVLPDSSPQTAPIFAAALAPAAIAKTSTMEALFASMNTTCVEAFRYVKQGKTQTVQNALWNAETHFKNFLPLMQRLEMGTRTPINRPLLFATMIGFLKEGALVVEQLLTAILLQRDPHTKVSHKLGDLLRQAALPLSFEERALILALDHAEILSRDIAHLEFVENQHFRGAADLLCFYYNWARNPAAPSDRLIDDSMFTDIMQLCLNLLDKMLPAEKGNKNAFSLITAQTNLKNDLDAFVELLRTPRATPTPSSQPNVEKDKIRVKLVTIEATITQLRVHKNAGYYTLHFDNLLYNKFARLHCEVMRHWELSAAEMPLHYADLSQLTHLIAEEFLKTALLLEGKSSDEDATRHDLTPRLEMLGIAMDSLSPAERNFCAQSAALLNVTRYASYTASSHNPAEQKKKQQMKVASKIDRAKTTTAALQEKDDDFQPVMNKNLKALQRTQNEMLEDLSTLATLLQRLLKKK